MAGSYPDAASRRMPWDTDGCVALWGKSDGSGALTEFTPAQITGLNSEDDSDVVLGGNLEPGKDIFVIFPELRHVHGVFVAGGSDGGEPGAFHTSGDTTNGRDGSWTQQIANLPNHTVVMSNYRSGITSTNALNQRGVRIAIAGVGISGGQPIGAIHLYGTISAGETPDRLLWVDNTTGSEFTLPIDYGDIPRGSVEDVAVKLRNNSASLTAASPTITAEDLYLGAAAWYTFAEAGVGIFQSTLALSSSIGAAADSPVITIRRSTPDSETPGLYAARALVNASWS